MQIAKVEALSELTPEGGGCAGSRREEGDGRGELGFAAGRSEPDERPTRKSGTYSRADAQWLPTPMAKSEVAQVLHAASVISAAHSRRFELDGYVAPEGSCRLVVFERGAQWPAWLARELSGGVTTYLVSEAIGDGLGGLVQRVEKRAQSCEMPVSQLIWLTTQSKRLAPMRWVKRLGAKVRPYQTIVIVPAPSAPEVPRCGLRRHSRPSMWPRAVVA